MHTLETKRLILRPLTYQDIEVECTVVDAHPDVWKFDPGYDRPRQEKEAELIYRILEYKATGLGSLEIVIKETQTLIGHCGLRARLPKNQSKKPANTMDVELYYKLARDYWGKGFAREAITVLMDHAFTTLKLEHVVAARVHKENVRSIKLMEYLGMTLEDDPTKAGCMRGVLYNKVKT